MEWKQGMKKWRPDIYMALGDRPCALLFAMGVSPNIMVYWVLLAASKAVREDPIEMLTEVRCRLYPAIGKELGLSPEAIDAHLRRAASEYAKGRYKILHKYMLADVRRPTPSEFLAAWLRMIAECEGEDLIP